MKAWVQPRPWLSSWVIMLKKGIHITYLHYECTQCMDEAGEMAPARTENLGSESSTQQLRTMNNSSSRGSAPFPDFCRHYTMWYTDTCKILAYIKLNLNNKTWICLYKYVHMKLVGIALWRFQYWKKQKVHKNHGNTIMLYFSINGWWVWGFFVVLVFKFYVYGCFVYMYARVLHAFLEPLEVRRGIWIPWD